MAPKKKGFIAMAPSTSTAPDAARSGGRIDAGGGGGGPELPRRSGDPSRTSNRSKDGAVLPTGGTAASKDVAAPSRMTASAHAPRPSQVTRDVQPHDVGGSRRPHEKTPAHHSQCAQGQDPRQPAGGSRARVQSRDGAPSNPVRSLSTSRSSHLSPPPTRAEALARAQLLLDFPPAAEKLDEWRATIQSLLSLADNDTPQQGEPSRR